MGTTQQEEVFPPPPPYQPTVAYQPPSGPPPCAAYQPPLGPPPGVAPAVNASSSSAKPGPPTLSEAPPIYEPFNFAIAYARLGQSNAPKWHSPPAYNIYHDPNSSEITFHVALPATEPPCACSNDFHCTCERRRPAIWQVNSSSQSSSKTRIELQRISPFSGTRQVAFSAAKDNAMINLSSSLTIRDERQHTCTRIKRARNQAWSYKECVRSVSAPRWKLTNLSSLLQPPGPDSYVDQALQPT